METKSSNRRGSGVTNNREDLTESQCIVSARLEGKFRPAADRHAIGNDLICLGSSGVQFVGVGRIVVQCESALNG